MADRVRVSHLIVDELFGEPFGDDLSSREGEELLDAAGFLPVHELLGRRRQVQRRHDVRSVGQLKLHLFRVDAFLLVDDELPFTTLTTSFVACYF